MNNSNTAAGVAGLIQGVTKFAKPIANKLPLGESFVTRPLENISLSMLGRGATNVPAALLTKRLQQQSLLDPLVIPGFMASGGLLSSP